MQVGDIVSLETNDRDWPTGVITDTDPCGWFVVLQEDGRVCLWPESQMEPLGQNELTDQQLEEVRGGMSAERFDRWRVERINEV